VCVCVCVDELRIEGVLMAACTAKILMKC
jgi:hypothetical protein